MAEREYKETPVGGYTVPNASIMPPAGKGSDVVWIQSELRRLSQEKASKEGMQAQEREITTRIDFLKDNLKSLEKCHRTEEIDEMKRAIDGWRTFFRNTVAVGSLGAIGVIGGWLWQFYSLTAQVSSTHDDIAKVNVSVQELAKDYQGFKKEYYQSEVEHSKDLGIQITQLEYRLTDTIAKASQGQKVAGPTTDEYVRARKIELKKAVAKAMPTADDVQLNKIVDSALDDELKARGTK